MEQFGFIIFLLLVGMLLQKSDAPADFARSLNLFVIYISFPATILLQVPKVHLDLSALGVILIPWLLLPIVVLIVILMTRHQPVHVRAALLLVMPLGNTSFVGIPIIHTLAGEEAIPYLLMYDQFGTFLMLSFYGSAVVAHYETGVFHKRLIIKKLFLFPPFLSLLFALSFGEIPPVLHSYVEILSSTLVPLALIAVGYSMKIGGNMKYGIFTQALALKLLIMPLLAWGMLAWSDIEPLALKTAVLESGMPSMITAGALAAASGFAPELSAALVGYGIIVSLITLPLWSYLLG